MYTNGIDVSEWQGAVNFQKAKNNGAGFSFIRAQFGLNQDNRFIVNWNNAKDAGLLRGAYMFPITSVSSSLQIIKFAGILDKDPGELPPVLDIEPYQDSIPNKQTILEYVNFILDEFGVYPIIYTGYYAWRDKVRSTDDIFAKCPLWIANYDVSKPIIPAPWKEWTFWQHSSHGDGIAMGASSLNIDMNRFNGSFPELKKFCGLPEEWVSIEPDTSDTSEKPESELEQVMTYRTLYDGIRIRTKPGLQSSICGYASRGEVIEIDEFYEPTKWGRIKGTDNWICITLDGKNFMEPEHENIG